MSHDRFYRPILSAINLAVELGSNFAEKIGRFYRSSVIGFRGSRPNSGTTCYIVMCDSNMTTFDKGGVNNAWLGEYIFYWGLLLPMGWLDTPPTKGIKVTRLIRTVTEQRRDRTAETDGAWVDGGKSSSEIDWRRLASCCAAIGKTRLPTGHRLYISRLPST